MRTTTVFLGALAVVALATSACKETVHHDDPAAAPTPVAAPTEATTPAPVGDEAMRTLGGRLAFEAAHRPTGTARVEDVMAVLAAAGVTIAPVKQYVGLTAAASYCAGGRTVAGLGVAVCEYESPAAAAAGRDHVEKLFANVSGREITIHGATTLTTTAVEGQDLTALRAKATQAFVAM